MNRLKACLKEIKEMEKELVRRQIEIERLGIEIKQLRASLKMGHDAEVNLSTELVMAAREKMRLLLMLRDLETTIKIQSAIFSHGSVIGSSVNKSPDLTPSSATPKPVIMTAG